MTVCGALVIALAAFSGPRVHVPTETAVASKADLAHHPSLTYVYGSTSKVEQIIGDTDVQTKQPTLNQTQARYSIRGTDLGYSFEYNGQTVFLFGDTLGNTGGDVIGYSGSSDPNGPLALDFVTGDDGQYLRIEPPGVPMGGYEVPVSGIAVNGAMYVAVKSYVTIGQRTDTTVLTKYDDATKTFHAVRTLSRLPGGHFITMTMRLAPEGMPGLPTKEPYVLMFGSGDYRRSNAYLAAVPAATFESGVGTVYYAGRGGDGASWTQDESQAAPIIEHPTIGDISVTYVPQAGLWVALYDARTPRGIVLRYAQQPWGPWSEPQVVFDPETGYGTFIHDPFRKVDDGLAGPTIAEGRPPERVFGGFYAPYIINRFTEVDGDKITLQYVMSTWNPYVVVRMKTTLQLAR